MGLKQVILVRNDLKLPKGKMAGQVAHAAVESAMKADEKKVRKWRSEGAMKIVCKVESLKELMKFLQDAKDSGFPTALITDAGKTTIAPGTTTCLGIGPDEEEEIDRLTGHLKLV